MHILTKMAKYDITQYHLFLLKTNQVFLHIYIYIIYYQIWQDNALCYQPK